MSERKQPIQLLDIGTGSGGIAHYFGTHEKLCCEVASADVVDQRQVGDGYAFVALKGVELPFEDNSFDVVISNHVIEHVGAREAQVEHLRELHRVLATDGVGYLAVPNRWMLVEPHYRLIFLSWLPRSMRSSYLRFMRRGAYYDCEPLTVPELEGLLGEAELGFKHLHVESIREIFAIEKIPYCVRWVSAMPDKCLMLLRRATPTLIYRLEKSCAEKA